MVGNVYDTAIYAQSWRTDTISRRLANAVDRLISYFDRWRLKVNIAKTDAILFTKRRPRNPTSIQLHGMDIPWSPAVTYLGLRLTSTLNYSAYIKTAAHKALGNLVQLFPLLANDSTLSVATKLHIYKAAIRSTMTYAAPVWCSISDSTYKQLEIVQNKCLRVITSSPRYTPVIRLRTGLGVDTIKAYVRRLATRFYSNCHLHPNPLIGAIGQYTLIDLTQMYKRYKHKRPKHSLLYVEQFC